MQNTSRKSSAGLLVLFVLALLLSLAILLFRKKAAAAPGQTIPRPQRNLNPFALIQLMPSNWVGLEGMDPVGAKGFLKFDTAANGTRAGFINLWNKYFSKGVNTIRQIAPIYTSAAEADAWAKGVSAISGIPETSRMFWPAHAHTLGRAIERFENGSVWVSNDDFKKGYDLATSYTNAR